MKIYPSNIVPCLEEHLPDVGFLRQVNPKAFFPPRYAMLLHSLLGFVILAYPSGSGSLGQSSVRPKAKLLVACCCRVLNHSFPTVTPYAMITSINSSCTAGCRPPTPRLAPPSYPAFSHQYPCPLRFSFLIVGLPQHFDSVALSANTAIGTK